MNNSLWGIIILKEYERVVARILPTNIFILVLDSQRVWFKMEVEKVNQDWWRDK